MSDSNAGNNREKGEGVNRPVFRGTKAARRKLKVVKTVGRCVAVWRKTEGGAGKERAGHHAGRGFSYSMPSITMDQIRARRHSFSFLLLCSIQGKLCCNRNYDLCLFVANSTARYNRFVLQQIYNMVLPAKDLMVPEFGD